MIRRLFIPRHLWSRGLTVESLRACENTGRNAKTDITGKTSFLRLGIPQARLENPGPVRIDTAGSE